MKGSAYNSPPCPVRTSELTALSSQAPLPTSMDHSAAEQQSSCCHTRLYSEAAKVYRDGNYELSSLSGYRQGQHAEQVT